jgi:anti-sigma factor RsiW
MKAVDHVQATELFSAYWDEELTPEVQSELEAHLKSCLVCRRELAEFEKAMSATEGLHKMIAPEGFTDKVKGRIRKRSRGRFFRPRRLAERIPYELFSLVMLGLLLAVYVVLQLAFPGKLKLP